LKRYSITAYSLPTSRHTLTKHTLLRPYALILWIFLGYCLVWEIWESSLSKSTFLNIDFFILFRVFLQLCIGPVGTKFLPFCSNEKLAYNSSKCSRNLFTALFHFLFSEADISSSIVQSNISHRKIYIIYMLGSQGVHWQKSRFFLYFPQNFPIFFVKNGRIIIRPIWEKKWFFLGKNTKLSHDFSQWWGVGGSREPSIQGSPGVRGARTG